MAAEVGSRSSALSLRLRASGTNPTAVAARYARAWDISNGDEKMTTWILLLLLLQNRGGQPPEWTRAIEPFQIAGPLYYVGTADLASYLFATPAGHVLIDDFAILGGGTLVHQFCRIGAHAFAAGGSVVLRDVPPYVMAGGNSAQPHGLNSEGLKRLGFTPQTLEALRRAYKTLYRSGLSLEEARQLVAEQGRESPEVQVLADFLARTTRGIIR